MWRRAALRPHLKGGVAYSTSKIGMDALTQVTNEEANPHNVRACLLCPGEGNTPLLDRRAAPPPQEQRLRMIQPEDIGEMVVVVAAMPQHVKVDLISNVANPSLKAIMNNTQTTPINPFAVLLNPGRHDPSRSRQTCQTARL